MKVQCRSCRKMHINGTWTTQVELKLANVYTFCPPCYETFLGRTSVRREHEPAIAYTPASQ
jgi:hypothetical protein